MSKTKQVYVVRGEMYLNRMPCSEVMMHMKLVDRIMIIQLLHPRGYSAMVQVSDPETRRPCGGPVTPGEAGLYFDESTQRYYFNVETKEYAIKLDGFTRAYLDCALWSSTDNSRPDGGDPLDDNYSIEDIAPEAMEQILEECAHFQTYVLRAIAPGIDDEQAGHDFWLTRNGHGTGFWDRGLGELGDRLTDEAAAYGGSDLYVGDDGQLYVSQKLCLNFENKE